MKVYKIIRRVSLYLGLLGIAALVFWSKCVAERGTKTAFTDDSSKLVRVVTFNAQLLPSIGAFFNRYPNADYRARVIADRLSSYDVIGLCEVFNPSQRALLLKELKDRLGPEYNCVLAAERDQSAFGIDSGLILISRFRILESHSMKFGNDSPVTGEHGLFADGFAAKGIIHARLAMESEGKLNAVDCFLTHLESADSNRREAQYAMLTDFIGRHSDVERPVLIMGDLNTRGDAGDIADPTSQYQKLLSKLRELRQDVVDLGLLNHERLKGTSDPELAGGGERIDYLFLSNPPENEVLRPNTVRVRRLEDNKTRFLSDHCAVEAELSWSAP